MGKEKEVTGTEVNKEREKDTDEKESRFDPDSQLPTLWTSELSAVLPGRSREQNFQKPEVQGSQCLTHPFPDGISRSCSAPKELSLGSHLPVFLQGVFPSSSKMKLIYSATCFRKTEPCYLIAVCFTLRKEERYPLFITMKGQTV